MSEIVNIYSNKEVRDLLESGVDKLVNAVKVTMGAGGKNVLIEKPFFTPIITKDGVTVAKSITLENKIENMGAQLIKDVAQKTADEVGDGTTTATVLAGAIFKKSLSYINSGYNAIKIKRYIDMYIKQVINKLDEMAIPVDDLEKIKNVALISANGDDEIANAITQATDVVGNDGVITVENSNSFNTYVEYTEGLQFDGGYVSPYFVNNPKKLETVFENPYLLVINGSVNNFDDIQDVLIRSLSNNRPIVILANDFSNEVINKSIQNRIHKNLKICLVRLPFYGEERKEFAKDISLICNGSYIDTDLGESIQENLFQNLMDVDKIIVTKNTTTVIKNDENQNNEKINERIEEIKLKLQESHSPVEQNTLRERLTKLSGSVAIIKVGGSSEVEVQEKKDRIDDALHATKASIKEGVVIGGGYALLKCSYDLKCIEDKTKENLAAYDIIRKSLLEPAIQILSNAGLDEIYIYDPQITAMNNLGVNINVLCEDDNGNNEKSYKNRINDLLQQGVIDPLLVEKTALLNASSVAGLLLTTDCGISLKKSEEEIM